MKRTPFISAKLALTLAAAILGSTSTLSWAVGTSHKVTASDVMLRSFHGSYTIGRLTQGQAFDVQATPVSGWYWGYAHGRANRCGWIQASAAPSSSQNKPGTGPSCGPAPTDGGPNTLIKSGIAYGPSVSPGGPDASMRAVSLKNSSCAVYGNPREDANDIFRHTTTGQTGARFFRYGTPDGTISDPRRGGKFAMIMDNNFPNNKWGFILNSCLKAWK